MRLTRRAWLYAAVPQGQLAYTAVVRHLRSLLGFGLLPLAAGLVGFALVQTATLAERVDREAVAALLFTTRLGQALLARAALTAVLAVLLATTRTLAGWRTIVAAGLSAGLLMTFSAAGHAAARAAPTVPILLDWLHLVGAAM